MAVCLPCNMMDLLGATVGRAAAETCPCKTAIGFLVRLGATHAAKIHAGTGTKEDDILHEQEEEKLFFPLARSRGVLSQAELDRFLQEHKLFREERKKYGKIISTDVHLAHAARENMLAEKLMAKMDEEPSVSGITRVGAEAGTSTSYKPSPGILAAGFVTLLGAGFLIAGALHNRYFT